MENERNEKVYLHFTEQWKMVKMKKMKVEGLGVKVWSCVCGVSARTVLDNHKNYHGKYVW